MFYGIHFLSGGQLHDEFVVARLGHVPRVAVRDAHAVENLGHRPCRACSYTDHRVQLGELDQPDVGRDLRDPPAAAEVVVQAAIVPIALPLVAQRTRQCRVFRAIGDDHSPFHRRHDLGRKERKRAGIGKGARFDAAHFATVRVRSIFNQE